MAVTVNGFAAAFDEMRIGTDAVIGMPAGTSDVASGDRSGAVEACLAFTSGTATGKVSDSPPSTRSSSNFGTVTSV